MISRKPIAPQSTRESLRLLARKTCGTSPAEHSKGTPVNPFRKRVYQIPQLLALTALSMTLSACMRTQFAEPPAELLQRCTIPERTKDPAADLIAFAERITECDGRAAGVIAWRDGLRGRFH